MKILVPIDGSSFALKALEKGIDMAKKEEGGEITLMSVGLKFQDLEGISSHYIDKMKDKAISVVDEAKEIVEKAGLKAKTIIEQGASPADNIISFAGEQKFDLIIIGHRGLTGLDKFLVGSVAERVVSYAPCSVLVVR